MQDLFTACLALTGRNNHARIGDCNADAGYDFSKNLIGNPIVKRIRVDIVRAAQPGNADGMGAYAFIGL